VHRQQRRSPICLLHARSMQIRPSALRELTHCQHFASMPVAFVSFTVTSGQLRGASQRLHPWRRVAGRGVREHGAPDRSVAGAHTTGRGRKADVYLPTAGRGVPVPGRGVTRSLEVDWSRKDKNKRLQSEAVGCKMDCTETKAANLEMY
jgi:hypothetical protein